MVRIFVFGLVPHRHLADDIVQETLLTACLKAHTYEPGSNFRAWILKIAKYKVLSNLRRHYAAGTLGEGLVETLTDELPSDSFLVERVGVLGCCVEKLALSARTAVKLRYEENLGIAAIAAKMGWSVNSVNVTLSRARVSLKRCIEDSLRRGEASGTRRGAGQPAPRQGCGH